MEGTNKVDRIKEKFAAYKDCIDQAEEREAEAKYKLRTACERGDKAEEDKDAMLRRQTLLQNELEKVYSSLETALSELQDKRNKTQTEQATEKELGTMELEIDEELNEYESKLKEATSKAEEKHQIYIDACRKHTKCSLDLDKACERIEKASERVSQLEFDLQRAGESMVELEAKDEVAGEREVEREEKISFMQAELKKLIEREDTAERESQKLERILDSLLSELEDVRSKTTAVHAEFDALDECCISDEEEQR